MSVTKKGFVGSSLMCYDCRIIVVKETHRPVLELAPSSSSRNVKAGLFCTRPMALVHVDRMTRPGFMPGCVSCGGRTFAGPAAVTSLVPVCSCTCTSCSGAWPTSIPLESATGTSNPRTSCWIQRRLCSSSATLAGKADEVFAF